MRKTLSLFTAAAMLLSCIGMTAAADDTGADNIITADKTAQWRNNPGDGSYDLRIHGWRDWETAAYIGFTLPDELDMDAVRKAELRLTTVSGSGVGTAYIYSADYSAFENGGSYTGADEAPYYDEVEFGSFQSSNTEGEVTAIDVTDAVKESTGGNAAFRIDVKSQSTNNKWVIGSCTNGAQPPQLVLISEAVELDRDSLTLVSNGESETLNAVIYGDSYTEDDLVWESSDENVVTAENGIVTPHKAGTATVTVSIEGTELSDSCEVTVIQSAEGVSLSAEKMYLSVGGENGELYAIVEPDNANDKNVTWESDNTEVAEVSSNGIVTPVSAGEANITAVTSDGGHRASCAVTVTENVPLAGISLDKTELTLPEKGATDRIGVIFENENASNKRIEWSSSDENVATVLDGVVTSVSPGTTVITAVAEDGGHSASCEVTVEAVENMITNDSFWQDTDGNNIYSQGGGIFKFGDKYYWYGVEYKNASEYAENPSIGGEASSENRAFVGFTCYSSTDLVNWDFEGYVMTSESDGMEDAGWVGRMGVVYNENTGKYVLVSQKYPGIMFATSDTPEGPFKYEKLLENVPYFTNGSTGDQTLFQDDDGKAYLICSSAEGRQYMYVAPLRESDFLDIDSENVVMIYRDSTRQYIDENGETAVKDKGGIEGNSLFKYNGHYYFTGSDLYGWNSSRVYVLESADITGPYNIQTIGEEKNLPYIMRNVSDNYAHNSQAGFYVTVHGTERDTVLYCGDRWANFANNGLGYNQWVPLSFDENGAPYDSFEMVKDQQIILKNGGENDASDPNEDNVYAEQMILAPDSTRTYDMGDGTVPVRFAVKSDRHSYYDVKVTVGCADPNNGATINLFNEKRHPVVTNYKLDAGATRTFEFTSNVMDVYYKNDKVSYEDDMLNIVLTGENAGLAAIEITRLDPVNAPNTIWVCSDSTGCDQPSKTPFYPLQNYCGVGQYLSKYLTDMTVSNQGEGGLASLDNAHFDSAKSQWKAGDYLYVEYGHNENSTDEYRSHLDKYYDAAHEAGVRLILVGPIDRIQDGRFSNGQWTSSLKGYSDTAKKYVEEKIAAGADDIAFVDLNAAWIDFLNTETERVAEIRYDAGLDTEKELNLSAPRYYYTYNRDGVADRTHINDYGADNAASIFFEQLKNIVETGDEEDASESQRRQAEVLRDIYDDINETCAPDKVSEDVVKEGYAPNSCYPASFVSRTEYPYYASIEDITTNEDGTLNVAKVRVLQDLMQYAAVYVTAYSENNEIIGTVNSVEHIDNTSDRTGTVKELHFDSDIVPHHFKADVYYCDENNKRLEEYSSAVSPRYESRKVIETILDEDWSVLEDGTSLLGNGWNSYGSMKNRAMTKRIDTDGESYAELSSSDGNSSYIWADLPVPVTGGKLEISFKLRARSGTVNISTGTARKSGSYGTVNSGISLSGTTVKNNTIEVGKVNTDEWIDYRYIIDIDNSQAELYIGVYDPVISDIELNAKDITQIIIDAASRTAYEADIKDITVCTVETYDFTVKDSVPISDPQNMDEVYRGSLHFGGKNVSDDEGIFGKTSEVYLLGNNGSGRANWISDTEKGASTSANMYASINIAMESGSNALLQFGQSGPGVRYQALDFRAASVDSDETISVIAGEKKQNFYSYYES